MKQLTDNVKSSWDLIEEDRRGLKIDMIDKKVTEVLLNTENFCRKLRKGEVKYSQEVSRSSEIW